VSGWGWCVWLGLLQEIVGLAASKPAFVYSVASPILLPMLPAMSTVDNAPTGVDDNTAACFGVACQVMVRAAAST
jgi:hypothetical protein